MAQGRMSRFVRFNAVGAGGMVLQLAVLACLVRFMHLPIVPATLLAVEAAVLHNFAWHERWTWRDRRAASSGERSRRLLRFHASNGLVSLAGNVVITAGLVAGGANAILANVVAIAACSLVNYASADLLVFSRRVVLIVAACLGSSALLAAQSSDALSGWQAYTQKVEARHGSPSGATFFALDMVKASRWRDRAKNGEVVMHSVEPPGIADAKLHHWAGAIYVPGTTVEAVVKRLQDSAGRESEFYEEVKASKLLERQGDRLRVFLRLYRDAGPVEATYNTEHAVEYRRINGTRATQRSVSTKIAELADAGTAREREKAAGDDSGFLWRLNAYWRYEQWGDGVLVECESVSLSRSVPFLIRPLANPIVDRIARESLARTLASLRKVLTGP
jgi:putative flippase GtrA